MNRINYTLVYMHFERIISNENGKSRCIPRTHLMEFIAIVPCALYGLAIKSSAIMRMMMMMGE